MDKETPSSSFFLGGKDSESDQDDKSMPEKQAVPKSSFFMGGKDSDPDSPSEDDQEESPTRSFPKKQGGIGPKNKFEKKRKTTSDFKMKPERKGKRSFDSSRSHQFREK